MMIRFQSFPRSVGINPKAQKIVECFIKHDDKISSKTNTLNSNNVLGIIREDLEKIEALKEDLDRESQFFMEKYKDAEPGRVRMHLEMMLVNEKVFQFLESQK